MRIKSNPIKKPLKGTVKIPGDKSISHRALIISSIAEGNSKISNILESDDVIRTLETLKELGVKISRNKEKIIVYGKGLNSLKKPSRKLYFGNSGTSARLMIGLLAGQNFITKITGDKSLSKRPMDRIIDPLIKMNSKFKFKKKNLPLTILGTKKLKSIKYHVPVASAQIKSGIILAALNAEGFSKIIEKSATRDHTELMLKNFKADIKINIKNNTRQIVVKGKKKLRPKNINIPGDFSSAAFFIVAATLIKDSNILLKNINLNPTRTGLILALKTMGAKIIIKNIRMKNGEKIGDIKVRYSKLKGCTLNKKITPTMIDEYPILSIAAANAKNASRFCGLKELTVKESNRLFAIKDNLKKLGVSCLISNDNLTIKPGIKKIKRNILIDPKKDHRIAMSFAVLGMLINKTIIIKDAQFIDTSFPGFVKKFNKIGAKIS